jgi:hypothetical protein
LKEPLQIPFDVNGNQQHFPEHIWIPPSSGNGNYIAVAPTFKDNYEWDGVLRIDDYSRGRSAAYFNLVGDYEKREYTMFMSDLYVALKNVGCTPGLNGPVMEGRWTFCKKGQNYGVKLVV